MYTITTKVSDHLNERLEKLAQISDRKKSYLVRKAIEHFIEEKEDYFIALQRLEQNNFRYSFEQLAKEHGLED